MAERFAVLGLAQPRAEWFRRMAQWSTGGSLPVEFVKCLTIEELHARLQSGRSFSAVLLDETLASVDRDLVATAQSAGCAVFMIVPGQAARRHWTELGADAVLAHPLEQGRLHDLLRAHARPVATGEERAPAPAVPGEARGRLVAVCGPGGTGTSTVAACIAQGFGPSTVLVDLALHAEQAMLHGVDDAAGLQSLVEAHRRGGGDWSAVAPFLVRVESRGYDLVTGLRRARNWSALRPHAFSSAIDSLLGHFAHVVCDTDGEVEGERETGSSDVEDRNLMSRTAVARADVVVVVGLPGMKGTHSLLQLISDLGDFGIEPGRVLPLINRSPKDRLWRRRTASTLQSLGPAGPQSAPGFLPDRPAVENALRDGSAMPAQLVEACIRPLESRLARLGSPSISDEPVRITPGSLGSWADGEAVLG